ncbi:hypothetical protein DPMN_114536 [Dreissena polymorpha]|uniref:Uncharacterized protein n=1 Tax=Dreissena polymorpha TaxID=45954 RepID=A0A9D4QRT8_DREPO|nr:hypothetical protein DPMN_114536 [Dreissena polymorpha]
MGPGVRLRTVGRSKAASVEMILFLRLHCVWSEWGEVRLAATFPHPSSTTWLRPFYERFDLLSPGTGLDHVAAAIRRTFPGDVDHVALAIRRSDVDHMAPDIRRSLPSDVDHVAPFIRRSDVDHVAMAIRRLSPVTGARPGHKMRAIRTGQ